MSIKGLLGDTTIAQSSSDYPNTGIITISTVPCEIFLCIANFLDGESLTQLEQTCKKLHQLVNSDLVWIDFLRTFNIEPSPGDAKFQAVKVTRQFCTMMRPTIEIKEISSKATNVFAFYEMCKGNLNNENLFLAFRRTIEKIHLLAIKPPIHSTDISERKQELVVHETKLLLYTACDKLHSNLMTELVNSGISEAALMIIAKGLSACPVSAVVAAMRNGYSSDLILSMLTKVTEDGWLSQEENSNSILSLAMQNGHTESVILYVIEKAPCKLQHLEHAKKQGCTQNVIIKIQEKLFEIERTCSLNTLSYPFVRWKFESQEPPSADELPDFERQLLNCVANNGFSEEYFPHLVGVVSEPTIMTVMESQNTCSSSFALKAIRDKPYSDEFLLALLKKIICKAEHLELMLEKNYSEELINKILERLSLKSCSEKDLTRLIHAAFFRLEGAFCRNINSAYSADLISRIASMAAEIEPKYLDAALERQFSDSNLEIFVDRMRTVPENALLMAAHKPINELLFLKMVSKFNGTPSSWLITLALSANYSEKALQSLFDKGDVQGLCYSDVCAAADKMVSEELFIIMVYKLERGDARAVLIDIVCKGDYSDKVLQLILDKMNTPSVVNQSCICSAVKKRRSEQMILSLIQQSPDNIPIETVSLAQRNGYSKELIKAMESPDIVRSSGALIQEKDAKVEYRCLEKALKRNFSDANLAILVDTVETITPTELQMAIEKPVPKELLKKMVHKLKASPEALVHLALKGNCPEHVLQLFLDMGTLGDKIHSEILDLAIQRGFSEEIILSLIRKLVDDVPDIVVSKAKERGYSETVIVALVVRTSVGYCAFL